MSSIPRMAVLFQTAGDEIRLPKFPKTSEAWCGRRPLPLAPSPAEPGRGKAPCQRSKSPSLARLERGIEGERHVGAGGQSVRSIERATDQPHPLASRRSAFPPLQRGEGAARRASAERGVRSVFRRKAPPPGPLPGRAREGEKRSIGRSKSPSLARLERGIEGERPRGGRSAIRLPKFPKTSEVWCGRRPLPLAPSLARLERGIEGVRPGPADA